MKYILRFRELLLAPLIAILFLNQVNARDKIKELPEDVAREMEVLEKGNAIDRYWAAYELGAMGPKAAPAIPALIKALSDNAGLVWEPKETPTSPANQAGWALSKIGVSAVPALVEAMNDKDMLKRRIVAETLGEIGPDAKEGIPVLFRALADEDFAIRAESGNALARIGNAAVPILETGQTNESKFVTLWCHFALVKISSNHQNHLTPLAEFLRDQITRRDAIDALRRIGPQAKRLDYVLAELLKDKNPEVRIETAKTLGAIGAESKDALRALIATLDDEKWTVRREAIRALAELQLDEELSSLVLQKGLQDNDHDIRTEAAKYAEKLGAKAKEFAPLLARELKDTRTVYFADAATKALIAIGLPAVPYLIELLVDNDEYVRRDARTALETITGETFGEDTNAWRDWWGKKLDLLPNNSLQPTAKGGG